MVAIEADPNQASAPAAPTDHCRRTRPAAAADEHRADRGGGEQVTGDQAVVGDVEDTDVRDRQADAGDHLRRDQARLATDAEKGDEDGGDGHGQSRRKADGPVGAAAEPAGGTRAEEVQREHAERHHDERLTGDPQPGAVQQERGGARRGSVKAPRTAVRPPTPSADQETARKMTAATSRQNAPRPSRIFGTDAKATPPRSGVGVAGGRVRRQGGAGEPASPASAPARRTGGRAARRGWRPGRRRGPWRRRAWAGRGRGRWPCAARRRAHRRGAGCGRGRRRAGAARGGRRWGRPAHRPAGRSGSRGTGTGRRSAWVHCASCAAPAASPTGSPALSRGTQRGATCRVRVAAGPPWRKGRRALVSMSHKGPSR